MQHIGTSGFSYPFWKNRFYPQGLPSSKWLSYYATKFDTLELNASFYRFPTVKTLSNAAAKTPDGFLFTVKAHKIITHTLRMRDAKSKIDEFLSIVDDGLGPKLACILYQLPPSYHFTAERLADIIENIPHESRHVVEFRHAGWWNEEVFSAFKSANITFCSVSYPGLPEDIVVTSDRFYKRMHGVPQLFKSSYSDVELELLASQLPGGATGFVYFNNTTFEAGYENALLLRQMIEAKTPRQ